MCVTSLFNLDEKCFITLINHIRRKINSISSHFYKQSKGYINSPAEGMIIKFNYYLSPIMATPAKKNILVVVALFW